MKIAVVANGDALESLVSGKFEESTYLLIIETDDLSFKAYRNNDEERSGSKMTNIIISEDCEALICGSIEEPAFEALVRAQVTRYMGENLNVIEALNQMETYQLRIIREYNGKEWAPHSHLHAPGSCNCGNHGEQ